MHTVEVASNDTTATKQRWQQQIATQLTQHSPASHTANATSTKHTTVTENTREIATQPPDTATQ